MGDIVPLNWWRKCMGIVGGGLRYLDFGEGVL